jgi:serine/threonine protein kinase/tetratricopeptide (TPR) repeat protein
MDRIRCIGWEGLLKERFVCLGQAGHGSSGVVFKAFDRKTRKPVAVKMFDINCSWERFDREVKMIRRVAHENLMGFVDYGVFDGNRPFMALEWIEGENLARWVEKGSLSLGESVEIVTQIARGLAVLHSVGIVHRDVKPANVQVWRTMDGFGVKLIDLGIARDNSISTITEKGALLGTPSYMSPELAGSQPRVDGRSDIYSLCAMLYEMACGRKPFTGESLWEILGRIMNDTAPRPRDVRGDIPEILEAIILRGMNQDPDQRYFDCEELLEALDKAARACPLIEPATTRSVEIPDVFLEMNRSQCKTSVIALLIEPVEDGNSSVSHADLELACVEQVERYAGDLMVLPDRRLLGVFGMHRAWGDETARSANAGFAILDRMPARMAMIHARLDRGKATEETTAKADRLLDGSAEPGRGIWIEPELASSLRPCFEIRDHGEGGMFLTDRIGWTGSGVEIPLGREDLVERLRLSWEASVKAKKPKIVILRGPVGIGKTAILRAFCTWLSERNQKHVAISMTSDMRRGRYGPVLHLMRRLAGIRPDLSERAQLRLAEDYWSALEKPNRSAHRWLLENAPPPADFSEGFSRSDIWSHWRHGVEKATAGNGLAWLIDDAHFFDAMSTRFLAWLIRRIQQPLLVVLSMPEHAPALDALTRRVSRGLVEAIETPPLPPEDAERLLVETSPDLDNGARQMVLRQAAGNPLYLLELARMSPHDGSFQDSSGAMQMIARARLSYLSEPIVRIVRAAAIISESAPMSVLASAVDDSDLLGEAAHSLAEEGLWRAPHELGESDEPAFAFRHRLIRNAIRDLVSPEEARVVHHCVARFYEHDTKQHLLAAHHYKKASAHSGYQRCLMSACEDALAVNDFVRADKLSGELAEMSLDRQLSRRARFLRAEALAGLGRITEGLDVGRALLGDDYLGSILQAKTAMLCGALERYVDGVDEARKMLDIAMFESSIARDAVISMWVCYHAGVNAHDRNDSRQLELELGRLRTLGGEYPVAHMLALELECLCAFREGNLEAAYHAARIVSEQELGASRGSLVGCLLGFTGQSLYFMGRYEEAQSYFENSLGLLADDALTLSRCQTLLWLGRVAGRLGDYEQAIGRLAEASVAFERMGCSVYERHARVLTARISLWRGRDSDIQWMKRNTDVLTLREVDPIDHRFEAAMTLLEGVGAGVFDDPRPHLEAAAKFVEAVGEQHPMAGELLSLLALLSHRYDQEMGLRWLDRAWDWIDRLISRCHSMSSRNGLCERIGVYRQVLSSRERSAIA